MKLLGEWGEPGWLLRLGWAEATDAARHGELSSAEQERAARLARAEDRAAYLAAHLLARDCARTLLGANSATRLGEWRQHCATCAEQPPRPGRTIHGRPSFSAQPGLGVSVAHSGLAVAALVSTAPCGVDLELLRSDAPVMPRMLGEGEARWLAQSPAPQRDLLRLWCRKEALFKARGTGDLPRIEVLGPDGLRGLADGCRLVEFPWPDGVLVAALGSPCGEASAG